MQSIKTVTIGPSEAAITVANIGHGLMMLTGRSPATADEQAFEAIKAGVDALPAGVKMVLNSGEFYGVGFSTLNLELLSRFYAKYPDYADKTFLSVKGGMKPNSVIADGSTENLRRSVETINKVLGGIKKMDLFQPARIPDNVTLEEMMQTLIALKNEGHFAYIGLSECSAATLRKAHAIHPISIVEIEVSMWSYEEETKKVISSTEELGVVIAAYSPLGRGFLTGTLKSVNDLAEGDLRRHHDRFQEEAFNHNMTIVNAMKVIAEKKGVTPGQLALAWVVSRGPHVMPIPGSSNKTRTLENLAAGSIELTPAEVAEIDNIIANTTIIGSRYTSKVDPKVLRLWA